MTVDVSTAGPTMGDEIGARIRRARMARGMSTEALSRATGGRFSVGAIASWERGERAVTAERLAILAEALAVPVADLYPPADGTERDLWVVLRVRGPIGVPESFTSTLPAYAAAFGCRASIAAEAYADGPQTFTASIDGEPVVAS